MHLCRVVVAGHASDQDVRSEVEGLWNPAANTRGKRPDIGGAQRIQLRCYDGAACLVSLPTDTAELRRRRHGPERMLDRKPSIRSVWCVLLPEPPDSQAPRRNR